LYVKIISILYLSSYFDLQRDTETNDSIRVRELINHAQARLARLAGLPGVEDDSYLADISSIWRQKLWTFGSEVERICYTKDTITASGLAPPAVSHETMRELSSPTSELRTAGDKAAHPRHSVYEGLIGRANEDKRSLLQELVSFAGNK
jgi:hypothetical protein